jgi:hypothetical protein
MPSIMRISTDTPGVSADLLMINRIGGAAA